jgi:hypothetical protein
MKPKISIITLGVRDFASSLAFYKDKIGLPTHNFKEGENVVFFEMEGTWLALYPRDLLAEDAHISPEGTGFAGITLAHNVGSKEEVDKVFAFWVQAGAKPVKEPQDVFWGGYSSYVSDPDGYLWEIAYNPFTDLT